MKRLITFLVAMMMIAQVMLICASADGAVLVNINEDNPIKEVDSMMYGINFEWGGNWSETKVVKGEGITEINPEYVKAFQGCMPTMRAAGMSANRMYWKGAVGPYSQRTNQTFWYFKPRKQTFGPVEWIKSGQMIQKDCQFVYTVNLNDTQENIADLVEFLRGDGTINYNGGINWAQKRIEYGIPDPVPIFAFELGNELDAGSEGAWTKERYTAACKETIATIRSIDPDAKIAVMKLTSFPGDWYKWHREVFKELASEIEYVVMHHYYAVNDTSGIEKYIKKMADDCAAIPGAEDIQILFTEHSCKPKSSVWSETYDYELPHTITGVLETAEWFARMNRSENVRGAWYHCIKSSSWAVEYPYEDTVKLTAIGDLLRMCNNNFVGTSVEIDQAGYNPSSETQIITSAVLTDDGMNIMLVNETANPVTYNFTFKNKYKLVGETVMYGDNFEADNYRGKEEVKYIDEKIDSQGEFSTYTDRGISLTILHLKKQDQE